MSVSQRYIFFGRSQDDARQVDLEIIRRKYENEKMKSFGFLTLSNIMLSPVRNLVKMFSTQTSNVPNSVKTPLKLHSLRDNFYSSLAEIL